jgi:hypothetical protein
MTDHAKPVLEESWETTSEATRRSNHLVEHNARQAKPSLNGRGSQQVPGCWRTSCTTRSAWWC